MASEYKTPCGKTMANGDNCIKGWLCDSCSEIDKLRQENIAYKSLIEQLTRMLGQFARSGDENDKQLSKGQTHA